MNNTIQPYLVVFETTTSTTTTILEKCKIQITGCINAEFGIFNQ